MKLRTPCFSSAKNSCFKTFGGRHICKWIYKCSYKRVKGRSHTVEKRKSIHPHKPQWIYKCTSLAQVRQVPPCNVNVNNLHAMCIGFSQEFACELFHTFYP